MLSYWVERRCLLEGIVREGKDSIYVLVHCRMARLAILPFFFHYCLVQIVG